MPEEKKCLFPGCQTVVRSRGLCHNHYAAVARFVRNGKVTWEQLEQQGKASPDKGVGKKYVVKNWLFNS